MIEKIVQLKNIGHFVDYNFTACIDNWDGQLEKINVIYAPNGSGKTTLATIFRSLKEENLLLAKFKHTFNTDDDVSIQIKFNNLIYKYQNNAWSNYIDDIDVFDSNFIEDYLFMGSIAKAKNKENLFKLILGQHGQELKKEIKPLIKKVEAIKGKQNKSQFQIENAKLQNKINDFNIYAENEYKKFISAVNSYLSKFTSYIKLVSVEHDDRTLFELFRIYLVFEVYGEKVKFFTPNPFDDTLTAKYALSEGDKSKIAMSIFLSRFKLQDMSNRIVIFDDPLSSFDSSRRTATVTQLSILAKNTHQFFLLTHDMNFAYDFYDRNQYEKSLLTLQIANSENGNRLSHFDIQNEILNKRRKNFYILKEYRDDKYQDDELNVVRSIRPALEDIIKIKYFDEIPANFWLGQIISGIDKANNTDRLYRLKSIKENLIQLNEYTQKFHHGLGFNSEILIDKVELKTNVNLFFKTLDNI